MTDIVENTIKEFKIPNIIYTAHSDGEANTVEDFSWESFDKSTEELRRARSTNSHNRTSTHMVDIPFNREKFAFDRTYCLEIMGEARGSFFSSIIDGINALFVPVKNDREKVHLDTLKPPTARSMIFSLSLSLKMRAAGKKYIKQCNAISEFVADQNPYLEAMGMELTFEDCISNYKEVSLTVKDSHKDDSQPNAQNGDIPTPRLKITIQPY